MKRFFFLITIAACALFVPEFSAASDGPRLVYRPELRAYVVAPQQAKPTAPASRLTPAEVMSRHEAMARGYRLNGGHGSATAADHCDRMVEQARKAVRKAS